MPMPFDHQLREHMPHDPAAFPITFFENEFAALPTRSITLHWHPEFELLTALRGTLELQVGQATLRLEPGESVLINGNVLHAMRQISGGVVDPMPNIVFSGAMIAPEKSTVYERYVQVIAHCDALPYVLFRQTRWQARVGELLAEVYRQMREQGKCYEMTVQRCLIEIFELVFLHFDELPRINSSRVQIAAEVRLQRMLSFIHTHYASAISLADIAASANVSKSEANRCFHAYTGRSPIDALIQHRLDVAHRMMGDASLTIREISEACGFHSESYFSRRYRQKYGVSPGRSRK